MQLNIGTCSYDDAIFQTLINRYFASYSRVTVGAGLSVVSPGYYKIGTLSISYFKSGRKEVGNAAHKAFLHKSTVIS
jgi:hypothetical protein